MIILHIIILFELFYMVRSYKPCRLNGLAALFSLIYVAVATSSIGAAVGVGGAIAIAAVGTAIAGITVYGGIALGLSAALSRKGNISASSPSYQAQLQTQTNPDLPVPLLYGTCKLAGNRIWQNDTSAKNIQRIVAFAEGEITDFTDIRLNDIETKDIKGINVQKFYGTSDQGLPSMIKLDTVGSLRNIAYLAITCDKTDKIDINYNLTSVVKGRKVRVYTTPTSYEVKYSENPAWVLFDFLTSYNGLGIALNNNCEVDNNLVAQLFDLETFIESAAFCDEEIETNGVKSPRFTFNMIFDSQTSARDLIDEIYRSCRGGLFTHNGKLQFKIDKAEPVSQVFTEQDIIKGSETFQVIPAEEHYEILRVSYISPEHEWQKVEAFAEIPVYRFGAPIEHSVNLYSCTNFQQASRLAWYYVNSKSLCPYFGSFQTDYRAYTLEVGDVIQIDSLLMGLKEYKVKVTSVKDDGSGVFTVNWRNYDERLYDDTLGCQEPRVLVSNLSDNSAYPEDVVGFNVVQSQNYLNFVWQYNTNPNDTYEIRYGESWESGEVIGKRIATNEFQWEIPQAGKLYRFWIKAFNNYNYSEHATLDVIQVDSIPNVNEIITFNLLNDLSGTFENTYFYKRPFRAIKLKTDVKWQTLDEKWTNTDKYYETNGKWGAKVYPLGYYTSQVYDIGGNLKSIMRFDIEYKCEDSAQYITSEWRYSEDGETWSDWMLGNIGEYQFRYCQFRAVFHADYGAQMFLTSYNIVVDVPDKEIEMVVEVPISDTTIIDTEGEDEVTINYDFLVTPSIIGTVNDNISAYIYVAKKDNKKATIKAYLNKPHEGRITTGQKVTANLRIKGY